MRSACNTPSITTSVSGSISAFPAVRSMTVPSDPAGHRLAACFHMPSINTNWVGSCGGRVGSLYADAGGDALAQRQQARLEVGVRPDVVQIARDTAARVARFDRLDRLAGE